VSGAARPWRIPGARAARYAGAAAADLSKIRTGAALSGLRRAGLGSDGATKRRSDAGERGAAAVGVRVVPGDRGVTDCRFAVAVLSLRRLSAPPCRQPRPGVSQGLARVLKPRAGSTVCVARCGFGRGGSKDSRIREPRPSVGRPCHPPGGSQLAHRMQSCATIPGDGAPAERDGAGGPCCPRRHTGCGERLVAARARVASGSALCIAFAMEAEGRRRGGPGHCV
jgi:hypothetical protein